MRKAIITECYADSLMLKVITRDNPNLQHQYGCNNVSRIMQTKFSDDLAIGVIDDDKRGIAYLKSFTQIEDCGALRLYKHPVKLHWFITLSPAIERFLLETASRSGILPTDYNLPSDLTGLKAITKSETSKNNPDLKRFFRALANANAEGFATIGKWIEEIPEQFK
jgi:hypothetical protein